MGSWDSTGPWGNFMSAKADRGKLKYLGDAFKMLFNSCCASLPIKHSQCTLCLDMVRKFFATDLEMKRIISITQKEHN